MTNFHLSTALAAGLAFKGMNSAQAASFIFAGDANGLDIVTHTSNYTGAGGVVTVNVGIGINSVHATAMEVSVRNVIETFNALQPTLNNLKTGEIANSEVDFESVLMHEMGHSLGLSHVNLASESSLPSAQQRGASTTTGVNGVFDLDAGADGVFGTNDDLRGDDQNLVYFKKGSNDPFDTNIGVVDSTTYTRDVSELPTGDTSVTIGTREAADELGYGSDTEAAIVQLSRFGETQRTLGTQDVVGLLYARSGLDSIAGTADDYTTILNFVGQTSSADILIGFDNTETDFAVSESSGQFLSGDDVVITSNNIYFNTGFNWFFNDELSSVPLPAGLPLMLLGLGTFVAVKRRKTA